MEELEPLRPAIAQLCARYGLAELAVFGSTSRRESMPREPRRDALYLADIVEAARTVARWLQDRSEHWDQDEILRNAVLRQLMVIGEAAACLSDETRDELPDVPWHEVRGLAQE